MPQAISSKQTSEAIDRSVRKSLRHGRECSLNDIRDFVSKDLGCSIDEVSGRVSRTLSSLIKAGEIGRVRRGVYIEKIATIPNQRSVAVKPRVRTQVKVEKPTSKEEPKPKTELKTTKTQKAPVAPRPQFKAPEALEAVDAPVAPKPKFKAPEAPEAVDAPVTPAPEVKAPEAPETVVTPVVPAEPTPATVATSTVTPSAPISASRIEVATSGVETIFRPLTLEEANSASRRSEAKKRGRGLNRDSGGSMDGAGMFIVLLWFVLSGTALILANTGIALIGAAVLAGLLWGAWKLMKKPEKTKPQVKDKAVQPIS